MPSTRFRARGRGRAARGSPLRVAEGPRLTAVTPPLAAPQHRLDPARPARAARTASPRSRRPPAAAHEAVRLLALAVSRMTGTRSRESSWRRPITSSPSRPGSIMSSTTRSGRRAAAAATAEGPSAAVCASYPAAPGSARPPPRSSAHRRRRGSSLAGTPQDPSDRLWGQQGEQDHHTERCRIALQKHYVMSRGALPVRLL